ncbi:hypothetical protein [Niabella beijingensis]|uniref:hypothetical protein n=1 Tax=Niabella beijingensis TaxID=2872700 RepID=UPI001CC09D34|nr:hypothetical protein [Niabella beijingensis]MBZ4187602.1 hypothetical protein [Niabella beijingensis]
MSIATYILNLEKRTDRKVSILAEFNGRDEFEVEIIQPVPHPIAAVSLWNTIKAILQQSIGVEQEYILICEDDHQFTVDYEKERLEDAIAEARSLQADVLCGGVSWWEDALPISKQLFWVKKFSGLQFTVIFKKFFPVVLSANFTDKDSADYKISRLSSNIFFCFPFLSTQKEFGYSDVTTQNNANGRVERLFQTTRKRSLHLILFSTLFKKIKPSVISSRAVKNAAIPTYIICKDRNKTVGIRILKQFSGKDEFAINLVVARKTAGGDVDLWTTIRHILSLAVDKKDDVIVICNEEHNFTRAYNRDRFIKDIIEAYNLHCEILCGNAVDFGMALPLLNDKFWVDQFSGTSFFILYKPVFEKILSHPKKNTEFPYQLLSSCSNYKMLLAPFVSAVSNELHIKPYIQTMMNIPRTPILNRLAVLSDASNRFPHNQTVSKNR